uniref:CN hydrolase domain-containing protein n=1 Tax=Desulfovibrio sp. U5L TaxID=596152 RepID=I2PZ25_9BACT
MTPSRYPLRAALADIKNNGATDADQQVALLYVAAVLQLEQCPPASANQDAPFYFALEDDSVGGEGSFRASLASRIDALLDILGNEQEQSVHSLYAREVVSALGALLHRQILAEMDALSPSQKKRMKADQRPTVSILGGDYILIPKYYSSRSPLQQKDEPDTFVDFFNHKARQGDGFDPAGPTFSPLHVAVAPAALAGRLSSLQAYSPELNESLASRPLREGLRIAVISLPPEAHHAFTVCEKNRDGQDVLRATEEDTAQSNVLAEAARDVVSQCMDNNIDLVVFPEYIRSPGVERAILETLKGADRKTPMLVVAGSWHDTIESKQNGDARCTNILRVFACDSWGVRPLLEHRKCIPAAVRTPPCIEELYAGPGLSFLETAIGLFSFGICKDFMLYRDDGHERQREFSMTKPFISFCPAMSKEVKEFLDLDSPLIKRHGGVFVLANACGMVRKHLRKEDKCCEGEEDIRSAVMTQQHIYALARLDPHGGAESTHGLDKGLIRPLCGRFVQNSGQDSNNMFVRLSVQSHALEVHDGRGETRILH